MKNRTAKNRRRRGNQCRRARRRNRDLEVAHARLKAKYAELQVSAAKLLHAASGR